MADGKNPYGPQYAQAGVPQQDDGLISRGLGALSGWMAKQGLWGDAAKQAELRKEKERLEQEEALKQSVAMRQQQAQQAPQVAPTQQPPRVHYRMPVNPWLKLPQLFDHMDLQPPPALNREGKPLDKFEKWLDLQNQFRKHANAGHPEEFVTAYKADTKKPGKIETVKTYFPVPAMQQYLGAANFAKQQGLLKDWTMRDLAAMALAEGRYDFGHNEHDVNNPQAKKIYADLRDKGFSHDQSSFIAALENKAAVARDKKMNKFVVWNGTGVSEYGKTGKDYLKKIERTKTILDDPRNKQFMEHLGLSYFDEPVKKAGGGSIGKPLPGGNKII